VSVTSSDNGQVSPAASNLRIVNRTVEGAAQSRGSASGRLQPDHIAHMAICTAWSTMQ
jgi:hypothetical protein